MDADYQTAEGRALRFAALLDSGLGFADAGAVVCVLTSPQAVDYRANELAGVRLLSGDSALATVAEFSGAYYRATLQAFQTRAVGVSGGRVETGAVALPGEALRISLSPPGLAAAAEWGADGSGGGVVHLTLNAPESLPEGLHPVTIGALPPLGAGVTVTVALFKRWTRHTLHFEFSLAAEAALPRQPSVFVSLAEGGTVASGGEVIRGRRAVFGAYVPAGHYVSVWFGLEGAGCPDGTGNTGPLDYECPPVEVVENLSVTVLMAALPVSPARIGAEEVAAHCDAAAVGGVAHDVLFAPPDGARVVVGRACVFGNQDDARNCFGPNTQRDAEAALRPSDYNPAIHAALLTDDALGRTDWGARLCDNIPEYAACSPDGNVSHDHDGNPLTPCRGPRRDVVFAAGADGGGTLSAVGESEVTLKSGDFVYDGVTVLFSAVAEEGFYLAGWSADAGSGAAFSHCARGTGQNGETLCEVAATMNLNVTVLFERPRVAVFDGREIVLPGQRTTVSDVLLNGESANFEMRYHGIRRGLHLIYSVDWTGAGARANNQGILTGDYRPFAAEICERGGAETVGGDVWRLPTFAEAAGAMAGAEFSAMTLAAYRNLIEVAGAPLEIGMVVPLFAAGELDEAPLPNPATAGYYAHEFARFDSLRPPALAAPLIVGGSLLQLAGGADSRALCVAAAEDGYGPARRSALAVFVPSGVVSPDSAVRGIGDILTLTMHLSRPELSGAAIPTGEPLYYAIAGDARITLSTEEVPDHDLAQIGPGYLRATVRFTELPSGEGTVYATVSAWADVGITTELTLSVDLDPPGVFAVVDSGVNGSLAAASGGVEFSGTERVADNAAVTFVATPDPLFSLDSWTGDCADGAPYLVSSELGDPSRPGEERVCVVRAGDHLRAGARFRNNQLPFTFGGTEINSAGEDAFYTVGPGGLEVFMRYLGVRRGAQVLYSRQWNDSSGNAGSEERADAGAFENGTRRFANRICAAGTNWRAARLAEIAGLLSDAADSEVVGRVDDLNFAPAGAAAGGRPVTLHPLGADDVSGDELEGFAYEMDSRDATGANTAAGYEDGAGVVIPAGEARRILCVRPVGEAAPDLGAVRLEADGRTIGDPVSSPANPVPMFRMSATLRADDPAFTEIAHATVHVWKHKDAPEVLPVVPEVWEVDGEANGFRLEVETDGDGAGARIYVAAESPRPAGPALVTVTLAAASTVGAAATIEVEARIEAERLPTGAGVPVGARVRFATVAADYAGSVAFFAAEVAGVTLRTPSAAPEGFGLETGAEFASPEGATLRLLRGLAGGGTMFAALTLIGKAGGHTDAEIPVEVNVSALVNPVARAAVDEGLQGGEEVFDFSAPSYAGGAYGNATLFAMRGDSSDLRADSDSGNVVALRALEAGRYGATVLASGSDFVGAAALTLSLLVRGDVPVELGVPDARREVKVAPGYGGSVAFFAASTAGATLRTPNASPSGFAISEGAEFVSPEGAVLNVSRLSAGESREATLTLFVSLENYRETAVAATVAVSALVNPVVSLVDGAPYESGTADSGENVFVFSSSVYAEGEYDGAAFSFRGDSADFVLSQSGGTLLTRRKLDAGEYAATILAQSPDAAFLGAAELTLSLLVTLRPPLPEASGIPLAGRTLTVQVAPDYSGSVAFFAAEVAGGIVRTPGEAPEGFALEVDASYVSPDGAVLNVATVSGGTGRAARFTLAVTVRGYDGARVPVEVTVFAPRNPAVLIEGVSPFNSPTVFVFSSADYADGAYSSASFSFLGETSLFTLYGGTVATRGAITQGGASEVTILAESPDFLGAARLTLVLQLEGCRSGEYELAPDIFEPGRCVSSTDVPPETPETCRLLGGIYVTDQFGINRQCVQGDGSQPPRDGLPRGNTTACHFGLDESHPQYEAASCEYRFEWQWRCNRNNEFWLSGDVCRPCGDASWNPHGGVCRIPGEFALSVSARTRGVTVASDYAGEVATFAGMSGATLRTPGEAPEGFSLETNANFSGAQNGFVLSVNQLPAGQQATAAFGVFASRTGFKRTEISLRVTVFALDPPLASLAAIDFVSSGPVFDFSGADFDGGAFADSSFALEGESADFELSASGGTLSARRELPVGGYAATVSAREAEAFLGEQRLTFTLAIAARPPVPVSLGIPLAERTIAVRVAPDYSGSVAFFAAARAGVTLRTPFLAPADLVLETEAEFVSPAGVEVSLRAALPAGEVRAAGLTLLALAGGFSETELPLLVSVLALENPLASVSVPENIALGESFSFASPRYELGAYAGSDFALQGETTDFTLSQSGGTLSVLRELAIGEYGATVRASGGDFLGEADLTLSLYVTRQVLVDARNVIPDDMRTLTIFAARNYAGEVARFAPATLETFLETPAAAPSGFSFATDSTFTHPEAMALTMLSPLLENASTVAAFTVSVGRRGFISVDLPLMVSVVALSNPAPVFATGIVGEPELDAGSALTAFALDDFPDAEFFEIADDADLFSAEKGGTVLIDASATPRAGLFGVTLGATASFRGTLEFALTLRAHPEGYVPYKNFFLFERDQRVTVSAFSYYASSTKDVEMAYLGVRRNLHVLAAVEDLDASAHRPGDIPSRRIFAGVGEPSSDVCAPGGHGWRFAKLSEVAGMLSERDENSVVFSGTDGTFDVPGEAEGLTISFPAKRDDDITVQFSNAIPNVMDNFGSPSSFLLDESDVGRGGLDVFEEGRFVCVRETRHYNAEDYADLAGIQIESEGGEVAVSLRTGLTRSPSAVLTLTASAYRYAEFDPGSFEGVARTLPDEAVSVWIAGGDADGFRLDVSEAGGSAGRAARAVLLATIVPLSAETRRIELAFAPPLGATTSLVVYAPLAALLASDILDDALPPEARNITVNAPQNYQGLAGRIVSRDSRASLMIAPQSANDVSIAADGRFYVASPLTARFRAAFELTIVAEEGIGDSLTRAATISIAVEPVGRIPLVLLDMAEGDDLSAVSLFAELAVPGTRFLTGATLRLPADAVLPEGFSRTAEGDVRGPASLKRGSFEIPFAASGGDAFVGEIPGVLRIVGNPAARLGMQFGGEALVKRSDRINNLRDAGGDNFDAVYWGRRRGLHYVVARLGVESERGGLTAKEEFDRALRRNPEFENNAQDTRWSLADYAAFCAAGGESGLGRRWRLPTIGEIAGLIYPDLNDDAEHLTLRRRFVEVGIPGVSRSRDWRVPLPPVSGEDTWGPTPAGTAAAIFAGTPIVPGNERGRTETPGELWAAALRRGSGDGSAGAFLPWERFEGMYTHVNRQTGETEEIPYNDFLRGAAGYAACVVEDSGAYETQPKLAVMELSYAGKNVKCPLSASPTENCNEAGHPDVADYVDSAFEDGSALRATIDAAATGADRVARMVTLRAIRFGGANGEAALSTLSGEVGEAELFFWRGASAMTLVKVSESESEAVFALSLIASVTTAGTYSEWIEARPRLGRAAALNAAIVATVMTEATTTPTTTPTPVGNPVRYHLLWAGPEFSGAVLTLTATLSGATLHAREKPGGEKRNGLSLSDAAATGGGVVVSLTAPLANVYDIFESGLSVGGAGISVGAAAAFLELLVSTAMEGETSAEATVHIAALRADYATTRIEVGVISADGVLGTLQAVGGRSYADANPDDPFAIEGDGVVRAAPGRGVAYHQRRVITAAITGESARGLYRPVELIINGPDSRPSPVSDRALNIVFPLVARPGSTADFPGHPVVTVLGVIEVVDHTPNAPHTRLVSTPARRFAVAPGHNGAVARIAQTEGLPNGISGLLSECAPRDGVWAGSDGVLHVDDERLKVVRTDGGVFEGDWFSFECPMEFKFARPSDVFIAGFLPANAAAGERNVALYQSQFSVPEADRRYYERPAPGAFGDVVEGDVQIELRRLESFDRATIYVGVLQDVRVDGSAAVHRDSLRGADGRLVNVTPHDSVVMGAKERAQVWRVLGEQLTYVTLTGGENVFALEEDGRAIPQLMPAVNRSYRLTAEAVAEGLAGTLTMEARVFTVPERAFAARERADFSGNLVSISIAEGWDLEEDAAATQALAKGGFVSEIATQGRRRWFTARAATAPGAGECRAATFRLKLWEDETRTTPAEFWNVLLAVGTGGQCEEPESVEVVPPPVKGSDVYGRIPVGATGNEIASLPMPVQATARGQFEAPDLSAFGVVAEFGTVSFSGKEIKYDSLGAATATVDSVSEQMVMTLKIADDGAMAFAERRNFSFTMTVRNENSQNAAATWEVSVALRTNSEYNLLFAGNPSGGECIPEAGCPEGEVLSGAFCVSACPTGRKEVEGVCVLDCGEGEVPLNGVCVSPGTKCLSRGWDNSFVNGETSCNFEPRSDSRLINAGTDGFRNAPGGGQERVASSTTGCMLDPDSGFATALGLPNCVDLFGPDMEFPQYANRQANYVYNCDPDGTRGLVPATHNTTGAERCGCANPTESRSGTTRAIIGDGPASVELYGQCGCTEFEYEFGGECVAAQGMRCPRGTTEAGNNTCTACESGLYESASNHRCTPFCPAGSEIVDGACVCPSGQNHAGGSALAGMAIGDFEGKLIITAFHSALDVDYWDHHTHGILGSGLTDGTPALRFTGNLRWAGPLVFENGETSGVGDYVSARLPENENVYLEVRRKAGVLSFDAGVLAGFDEPFYGKFRVTLYTDAARTRADAVLNIHVYVGWTEPVLYVPESGRAPVLRWLGGGHPTGRMHTRESRGIEDRKQKDLHRGGLAEFGIAKGYFAGVDRSGRGYNPRPAQGRKASPRKMFSNAYESGNIPVMNVPPPRSEIFVGT